MYNFRHTTQQPKTTICPNCAGRSFLYKSGKIVCRNCDYVIKLQSNNKYGAKKTIANDGIRRDSKYEASVADNLFARKQLGDIKDYESQFRVDCWAYDENGNKAFCVRHKVDFRIHHKDGSYELLEAKGVETSDYKWRRKCLETLWLPIHKDHI